MDNHFENKDGEQNNAQGNDAVGKQVNNYGVPPELFAQYVSELGVTDSALANFFKILEEQQVARGDLDSKLREIAFRHKELPLRFKAVHSDDPQVQALKEQATQEMDVGNYSSVLQYYEQSLAISYEIGDQVREAAALNNIGQIYSMLGDYTAALSFFERSLMIHRMTGDRANEAVALNNIAHLHLYTGATKPR